MSHLRRAYASHRDDLGILKAGRIQNTTPAVIASSIVASNEPDYTETDPRINAERLV